MVARSYSLHFCDQDVAQDYENISRRGPILVSLYQAKPASSLARQLLQASGFYVTWALC
jgi:hypothetical protein